MPRRCGPSPRSAPWSSSSPDPRGLRPYCGSVTLCIGRSTAVFDAHHRLGRVRLVEVAAVERLELQAAPHPADVLLLARPDRGGEPVEQAVLAEVDQADDHRRAGEHIPDLRGQRRAELLGHAVQVVELAGAGDVDVELHAGGLRQVAHAGHRAMGDVPERALPVAQPGTAQRDAVDHAGGEPEVDAVADAVLVLGEHEEPGDEVAHERLRAEGQRAADDRRRGDERADVDADLADDRDDRRGPDEADQRRSQDVGQRPRPGADPGRIGAGDDEAPPQEPIDQRPEDDGEDERRQQDQQDAQGREQVQLVEAVDPRGLQLARRGGRDERSGRSGRHRCDSTEGSTERHGTTARARRRLSTTVRRHDPSRSARCPGGEPAPRVASPGP